MTDESGSITEHVFDNDVKTFIAEIIAKVNDVSEVAYVGFSDTASVSWGFTNPMNALDNVVSEDYSGGFTNINAGVNEGLLLLEAEA